MNVKVTIQIDGGRVWHRVVPISEPAQRDDIYKAIRDAAEGFAYADRPPRKEDAA